MCQAELPDMKMVELKPREFHRRIGWALAEARRGVAVVITARGQPAVTLSLGRPQADQGRMSAGVDWDAHFAWLKGQPKAETNPVDELRAQERR
jgi:hypothetical protein